MRAIRFTRDRDRDVGRLAGVGDPRPAALIQSVVGAKVCELAERHGVSRAMSCQRSEPRALRLSRRRGKCCSDGHHVAAAHAHLIIPLVFEPRERLAVAFASPRSERAVDSYSVRSTRASTATTVACVVNSSQLRLDLGACARACHLECRGPITSNAFLSCCHAQGRRRIASLADVSRGFGYERLYVNVCNLAEPMQAGHSPAAVVGETPRHRAAD